MAERFRLLLLTVHRSCYPSSSPLWSLPRCVPHWTVLAPFLTRIYRASLRSCTEELDFDCEGHPKFGKLEYSASLLGLTYLHVSDVNLDRPEGGIYARRQRLHAG